jgi:hypothetical protein
MINDLWYKNAVIYCVSVATFMDANGDGIGDFKGLMRRLDYLQGLGITASDPLLLKRSRKVAVLCCRHFSTARGQVSMTRLR